MQDFKTFYYAPLLMFNIEIITLAICLRRPQKKIFEYLFIAFVILDILIFIMDYTLEHIHLIDNSQINYFINISNTIVSIAELVIYSCYFSTVLNKKAITITLIVLNLIYLILCVVFFTTQFNFINANYSYMAMLLNSTELICIIPFCLLNYKNYLKFQSNLNLQQRPSFWITSGILFSSTLSIAFYILAIPLLTNDKYYYFIFSVIFYYFPLCINFICIARAFLCGKPLTA